MENSTDRRLGNSGFTGQSGDGITAEMAGVQHDGGDAIVVFCGSAHAAVGTSHLRP